jgi:predicted HicB family RNase H-like nuclease
MRNPRKQVSTQTCVRIPAVLHEQVLIAQTKYDCTYSDMIRDALKHYFEHNCGE